MPSLPSRAATWPLLHEPAAKPLHLYDMLQLRAVKDGKPLPWELTKEILKYVPERTKKDVLYRLIGCSGSGRLLTRESKTRRAPILPDLLLEGRSDRYAIAEAGERAKGNVRLLLQCLASDNPLHQAIALEALLEVPEPPFPQYSDFAKFVPTGKGYVNDTPDYYVMELFAPGLSYERIYQHGQRVYENTTHPEAKLAMLSALLKYGGPTITYKHAADGHRIISNLDQLVEVFEWQFNELEKHKKELGQDYGEHLILLASNAWGDLWQKVLDAAQAVSQNGEYLLSDKEQAEVIKYLFQVLAHVDPEGTATVSEQRKLCTALDKLADSEAILLAFVSAVEKMPPSITRHLSTVLEKLQVNQKLLAYISIRIAANARNQSVGLTLSPALSDEDKLQAVRHCVQASVGKKGSQELLKAYRRNGDDMANLIGDDAKRAQARILLNTKIMRSDPDRAWKVFQTKSVHIPPMERYFAALDFLDSYQGNTLNETLLYDIRLFACESVNAAFTPKDAPMRMADLKDAIARVNLNTELHRARTEIEHLQGLSSSVRIAALLEWMGKFSVEHIFDYEDGKRIDRRMLDADTLVTLGAVAMDIYYFDDGLAPWDMMQLLTELEKWKLKERAAELLAFMDEEDDMYATLLDAFKAYPNLGEAIAQRRTYITEHLPSDLVGTIMA